MEARRRNLARLLALRQCSEERANTLERPIEKGGCSGLRIFFSNEVESMKERSDPTVVAQNAMLQRTQGRRATVAWSMLAELLNILVFQTAEHKDRKGAGLDTRTHAKKVHSVLSDLSALLCFTFCCRACC